MKVAILTSGHPPTDERIFYKFGYSLKKHGFDVTIVSSTESIRKKIDEIDISGFQGENLSKKNKVKQFLSVLIDLNPDVIICCEPLTILPALKFRKRKRELKIISDVTEFYPHQNMLKSSNWFLKLMKLFYYNLFNIYVSNRLDLLIIGEKSKARFYYLFTPRIKKEIITYYPSKSIFNYSPPRFDGKIFTICYSGIISVERGFLNFIKLVQKVLKDNPAMQFRIKVIGEFQPEEKELLSKELERLNELVNAEIIYSSSLSYPLFAKFLEDVDICFDLREKTKIFNRSLPIKIFDYMACGKPVIYSKLDSLKAIPEINSFALLTEPNDYTLMSKRIGEYLSNQEILLTHSRKARDIFLEKYNWEIIENKFIGLIESL
jgi:glycosyltransferase involved in cell wall biosynthesis